MGSFKLGKMTLRSLFSKPETIRYPFEEPEHPACMKGLVEFDYSNCIYCGICEKRCPTNAISVSKEDETWTIDHFACIQCGSCIRECPKSCLTMDPVLVHPSTTKTKVTVSKPEPTEEEKAELARKEAEKAARIKAAKEAKAAREKAAAEQDQQRSFVAILRTQYGFRTGPSCPVLL